MLFDIYSLMELPDEQPCLLLPNFEANDVKAFLSYITEGQHFCQNQIEYRNIRDLITLLGINQKVWLLIFFSYAPLSGSESGVTVLFCYPRPFTQFQIKGCPLIYGAFRLRGKEAILILMRGGSNLKHQKRTLYPLRHLT